MKQPDSLFTRSGLRQARIREGVCILACLLTFGLRGYSQQEEIKIDADRSVGTIDPMIYGSFTEYLGRCIYGGIYDPPSPQSDSFGFRRDVMQAVHEMRVTVLRWPGGNFASDYHWMDGIGPRNLRPKRRDLAWNAVETNQVGTDEFLSYARRLGVRPYICVNLGTGTLDEAKNWVEYCNGDTGTYYADLRAKYGHPAPYKVEYWGLGNEMDGEWQIGHKNAVDYGKFARETAKLMKWEDPSIHLVASGSSNYGADWIAWNRTVLSYLRNQVDYISLHYYTGNYDHDHLEYMARLTDLERKIRITAGLIRETRAEYDLKRPIYIALDEYNVWYRAFNAQHLEEHYNLEDALVIAEYFNCILREAAVVRMANLAQLVNVIAPMMITHDTLWKQTIFSPFSLFSRYCHGVSLDIYSRGPRYSEKSFRDIPYLDVSAVLDTAHSRLILNVVNRSANRSITAGIENQSGQLDSRAEVYQIAGSRLDQENSPEAQPVHTRTRAIRIAGNHFSYLFPPNSFTMIRMRLQRKAGD